MDNIVRSVILLLIITYIDGVGGFAVKCRGIKEIMVRVVVFAGMAGLLFSPDRCVWSIFGFTLTMFNLLLLAKRSCQCEEIKVVKKRIPRICVSGVLISSAMFFVVMFYLKASSPWDGNSSGVGANDKIIHGHALERGAIDDHRLECALKSLYGDQDVDVVPLCASANGRVWKCKVGNNIIKVEEDGHRLYLTQSEGLGRVEAY